MPKLFTTDNNVKVICDNGQDITLSKFKNANKDYQTKFINVTNKVYSRYDLVYLEIEGSTYGVSIEALKAAITNVERTYSPKGAIK
ncbi:hypothetical protein ACFQ3R_06080 [Mesonia ostreae]|uniref:Uncharacterized protein n=1 Tax=Mesonia ostreae TaxID=861110 RepID=A0ABU2KHA3_9FLAO|nr:hypothetical protein [Mesonia ostreae]MDT0294092.1 hypothetical protein [Mesonia ostreae]